MNRREREQEDLLREQRTTAVLKGLIGQGSGASDHGALTGLADDDHTQYLNNARGDARYAATSHTHVIANVTGLQGALDGKAAATHTHVIADTTGLQTALDGKAATSHTHTASEISDSTAAGRSMLTAADVAAQTALLNVATSSLKGMAPASGGGTTNFLRADLTWAAPAGGGGLTASQVLSLVSIRF